MAVAFQILTQFNSLSLKKIKAAIRCPAHFHLTLISLEKVSVSVRARARRGAPKWPQAGKRDGKRVGRQGRRVRTRRTSSFLPWQDAQHEFMSIPREKADNFLPKLLLWLTACRFEWSAVSVQRLRWRGWRIGLGWITCACGGVTPSTLPGLD